MVSLAPLIRGPEWVPSSDVDKPHVQQGTQRRIHFAAPSDHSWSLVDLRLTMVPDAVRPHRYGEDMAFGQPSGPPATAAQMRELLALVVAAGHTDFRDARGPLQLTQRQAAGKFTREEAEEYIERLQAEAETATQGEADLAPRASTTRASSSAPRPRPTTGRTIDLRGVPSEVLAGELQSRGWVVMEP